MERYWRARRVRLVVCVSLYPSHWPVAIFPHPDLQLQPDGPLLQLQAQVSPGLGKKPPQDPLGLEWLLSIVASPGVFHCPFLVCHSLAHNLVNELTKLYLNPICVLPLSCKDPDLPSKLYLQEQQKTFVIALYIFSNNKIYVYLLG